MTKKLIVTVGLGYGDEGKGSIVDFLAYQTEAGLVVRYNGGPQAAHNVIEPTGRHHTFAQFGSGTFAGAKTHVSPWSFVNLLSLAGEAEVLAGKGVLDPSSLVTVDPRVCFITPFHVHVNQMREIARGNKRYGSCGMGFGETVRDVRNKVGLCSLDIYKPDKMRRKLDFIWRYKLDQAEQIYRDQPIKALADILKRLAGENYVENLARAYENLLAENKWKFKPFGTALVETKNAIIFEGAQGVLLDEQYGFYPHITHSRTTSKYAEDAIYSSAVKGKMEKLGIMRAYASRHGCGPFVTEDGNLTKKIPDKHNKKNEWQGRFRIGWFDLVASRYALSVTGGVDSLAITNLDRLSGVGDVKVCTVYRYLGQDKNDLSQYFDVVKRKGKVIIHGIKANGKNHAHNGRLAELLMLCQPAEWKIFKGWPKPGKADSKKNLSKEMLSYLDYLQSPDALDTPISIVSLGPTRNDKLCLTETGK